MNKPARALIAAGIAALALTVPANGVAHAPVQEHLFLGNSRSNPNSGTTEGTVAYGTRIDHAPVVGRFVYSCYVQNGFIFCNGVLTIYKSGTKTVDKSLTFTGLYGVYDITGAGGGWAGATGGTMLTKYERTTGNDLFFGNEVLTLTYP